MFFPATLKEARLDHKNNEVPTERRENARKLMLTFLKCIYDEFNNKCVFALLKNRNQGDYPVL